MTCFLFLLGLKLQGAVCKNNTLELSSTISTELPLTSLSWIRSVSVSLARWR